MRNDKDKDIGKDEDMTHHACWSCNCMRLRATRRPHVRALRDAMTSLPGGPRALLACWLAGWPVGRLAHFLASCWPGRLAAWPPGLLAPWPPGPLAPWPPGHLASWPPSRLAACMLCYLPVHPFAGWHSRPPVFFTSQR